LHGMPESRGTQAPGGEAVTAQDTQRLALRERKSSLRERAGRARRSMSVSDRERAGRELRDTIFGMPEAGMAGTVAAYLSIGTEPATSGLVFGFWKRGSYVLLPVLRDDNDLDWACYEGPESLEPGPRGLLQPTEPRRGTEAIRSADLVIVPALAVDRAGNRLGRGGGSYDRALARVGAAVPTVALLYDGELLDELPAEAHDQRVRYAAQPGPGIARLG
jgi:5-formyltetrahydrofolate cyclo-ligase